jgi:hypothetical protein
MRTAACLVAALCACTARPRAPALPLSPSPRDGWSVTEAVVDAGANEPPATARARALAEARRAVAERTAGIRLRTRFLHLAREVQGQTAHLAERLSTSEARGLLVDERILEEGLIARSPAGGYSYRVRLAARVVPRGRGPAPCRIQLALSRTTLVPGDEVLLTLRADRDLFVHLFTIEATGRVTPLAPGPLADRLALREGRTVQFPGEDERARGVRLEARLPPGTTESLEQVTAVAFARDGRPWSTPPEDAASLWRTLAAHEHPAWCEARPSTTPWERPNNALDAEETAFLHVRIDNQGRGPALDVRLRVQAREAGEQVTVPRETRVGTLAAGESRVVSIPVRAGASLRAGPLFFEVRLAERYLLDPPPVVYQVEARPLRPPDLAFEGAAIADDGTGLSRGNGNGVVEPGEDIELSVLVRNRGPGPARQVTVHLVSRDPAVVTTLGQATVGVLWPGEQRRVRFAFRVSPSYAGPAVLPLDVVLDACYSGAGSRSVSPPGQRPLVLTARDLYAVPANARLLAASRATEAAGVYREKRHGLLTYFFARGLRGAAEADREGWIRFGALSRYVRRAVPARAALDNREQHPVDQPGAVDLGLTRVR